MKIGSIQVIAGMIAMVGTGCSWDQAWQTIQTLPPPRISVSGSIEDPHVHFDARPLTHTVTNRVRGHRLMYKDYQGEWSDVPSPMYFPEDRDKIPFAFAPVGKVTAVRWRVGDGFERKASKDKNGLWHFTVPNQHSSGPDSLILFIARKEASRNADDETLIHEKFYRTNPPYFVVFPGANLNRR